MRCGLTKASFLSSGNLLLVRQVLIITVISSMMPSEIFLRTLVVIGSSCQCIVGILYIMSRISLVDMCLNDDILGTSLTGGWYYGWSSRSDQILSLFSMKKVAKDLNRSSWLSQSGSEFSGVVLRRLLTKA